MKCSVIYSSVFIALVFFVGSSFQTVPIFSSKQLAKKNDIPQARIEPVTTTLIVSALAPLVLNLFTGLLGSLLNKPNDIEERVIYGRPMQIKLCGEENCLQMLDKGSGLTAVGKGDTVQHALGDATSAMLTILLEKKLLSMHDLCREHIHFPHPDKENCPGVEINTCELSKPILPTPGCFDHFGDKYCKNMAAHCKDTMYATFMMSNCYKTCTDNCYKPPPGPCDY
jgi:hypothetical protein